MPLAARFRPHQAVGGDEVLGLDVEALRGKLDQRLARGGRGLPDLHAAALDAVRAGGPPLVGRERGVALDIFDLVDADAELLGGDLGDGDAQPLAEIDLAAEDGDRAVAVDGEEGIDLLGVEDPRGVAGACGEQVARARRKREADRERAALEDRAAGETGLLHVVVMSASLPRCQHDRAQHAHMGAAAAEIAVERGANIGFGRLRFFAQQGGGAHDHAAGAIAALRHLLLDEGGLDRMRGRLRSEALERGDRLAWTAAMVVTQEGPALPSMSTMQAPHWPRPQPNLAAVRPMPRRT